MTSPFCTFLVKAGDKLHEEPHPSDDLCSNVRLFFACFSLGTAAAGTSPKTRQAKRFGAHVATWIPSEKVSVNACLEFL